jgi:signal peptidase I
MTTKKSTIAYHTLSLVIAILLAILFRSVAYEPYRIPSSSMVHNFLVGDFLFVEKYAYGFNNHSFPLAPPLINGRAFGAMPKRGDVMVFDDPKRIRGGRTYIKRVMALPGDRLQMKDGVVYINDQPLAQNITGNYTYRDEYGTIQHLTQITETNLDGRAYTILRDLDPSHPGKLRLDNTDVYTVPEGHVFGMGDNRNNSGDSRVLEMIGYVPLTHVLGKAVYKWLSFDWDKVNWYAPWTLFRAMRLERFFTYVV